MKSFPSTINESQSMYGNGKANSYSKIFDIDRLVHGALNLNQSVPVINEQLKENNINIANFQAYQGMSIMPNPSEISVTSTNNANDDFIPDDDSVQLPEIVVTAQRPNKIYYENPLQLPAEIIALAKDYDWAYRYMVKSLLDSGEKSGDSLKVKIANTAIAPSMFNPVYGVNVTGIIRNTPLLNDLDDSGINQKISDCSIRMLCSLSKHANSELGMARYKYSDFMYCKDLGKVSNNHLITLRRFAHPVGDHIFEMSTPKMIKDNGEYTYETEGDVGRLITWFGTDDNKLEDIIKFSYGATWKHLEAKIEEKESTADDASTGLIGMISNSFNPVYNNAVNAGQAGTHSIWGWLGSKLSPTVFQGIGKNNELLRNYDNNKVYTPRNTLQENHIYEGKLVFTHEFTLNFSYKLRAYDNINPRSAFLDLIGNILEVTYRRGKFWGGERKLIGPPQNTAPFRTVNNYIDNAWDKLGGMFSSLSNGNYNLGSILGSLTKGIEGAALQIYNSIKDSLTGGTSSTNESSSQYGQWLSQLFSGAGVSEAAKGYLKNSFGRPTAIAWQSLVQGTVNGLWHVTIGNPRNPIMAIGNLIMTDANIVQSGPLGIDDFPTELRVSVTLKHCMPRDATDIGRMYTKGASAIYFTLAHHKLDDFFKPDAAKGASSLEEGYIQPEKQINLQQSEVTAISNTTNEQFEQEIQNLEENGIGDSKQLKGYYNNADLGNDSLPNPLLTNDEEIKISRTNNFSDLMLRASIEEVA